LAGVHIPLFEHGFGRQTSSISGGGNILILCKPKQTEKTYT